MGLRRRDISCQTRTLAAQEPIPQLSSAIGELPADYRTVVLLRDVEGLSHQEIAETLGLTVVAVKTRVHRARLFLRKRLDTNFSSAGVDRGTVATLA